MGLIRKYYDDKWDNFLFVIEEIGDWKHAEQLRIQVLDMRKELLGAEHPDTLTSMKNLSCTYSHQGRIHDSEKLELEVMSLKTDRKSVV